MNFDVIPLFSRPVYISKFDVPEEIKQKLYSLEYTRMHADNGCTTTNDYVLNLEEFKQVKKEIEDRFHDYIDNAIGVDRYREYPPLEFFITNSWVVKHVRGDWGHKHSHQNAMFSGIVYLDVDDNTGEISFHDKENSDRLFPPSFFIPFKNSNLYSASSMAFKPKIGDIFFFPSNLEHSISEHKSDRTRYALAFNFWMRGKLGQFNGELIL